MTTKPENHSESTTTPRLIPLSHWNRYHAWPPQGGLRHLAFHAESNGFESCLRRVGRRVLIDEAAFFEWVERQNDKGSGR